MTNEVETPEQTIKRLRARIHELQIKHDRERAALTRERDDLAMFKRVVEKMELDGRQLMADFTGRKEYLPGHGSLWMSQQHAHAIGRIIHEREIAWKWAKRWRDLARYYRGHVDMKGDAESTYTYERLNRAIVNSLSIRDAQLKTAVCWAARWKRIAKYYKQGINGFTRIMARDPKIQHPHYVLRATARQMQLGGDHLLPDRVATRVARAIQAAYKELQDGNAAGIDIHVMTDVQVEGD